MTNVKQPHNVVYGNYRSLFRDSCKTHKYIVLAEWKIWMLNLVVHKKTTGFKILNYRT